MYIWHIVILFDIDLFTQLFYNILFKFIKWLHVETVDYLFRRYLLRPVWQPSAHYNDVIMDMGHLKSRALRLFTQPFIQAQIKENIKALRHSSLRVEFTSDRSIPRTRDQ